MSEDEKNNISTLENYASATEYFWVQEEHENMGAYSYIRPYLEKLLPEKLTLRYVGRERSASPSAGSGALHKLELAKFLKGRSKNSISHPAKPPKEGHTTIYAGTPEAIENVRKLGSNYILESLPHGLDHLPKASKVLRTDYFDFFTETGAGREALFGFRNNDHSLRDLNGGRYAAALYFRGYGTWMGITAWQYDLQAALDHIKATPGYALFINKPGHYRHQIMIEGDDLNNITLQEALVASSWSDTNVQSLCPLYIPTKEECLQLTKAEDNISEYFELPKEMFALDIGGLRAAGALKVKGFYDTIGRDEDCDEEDDYDDGFNGGHYR